MNSKYDIELRHSTGTYYIIKEGVFLDVNEVLKELQRLESLELYNDDDVVFTSLDELMTFNEAFSQEQIVVRKATSEEENFFLDEASYWRKQAEDQQAEDNIEK